MLIHVLMGQRKESYAGEYAPEALAVISDEGMDDNPDYMADTHAEHKSSGEFENLVVFSFQLDAKAVMAALRPQGTPLAAKIVGVS